MQLEDWLDDLCVRFIVNLPPEELASVERICFQVEEAQWFYEDFIRPLDPTLPSLNLKQFSLRIFQHCPLFSQWSAQHHTTAFAEFLAYKQRVPVRGAIMLNENMDEVVLVKGWKKGANWSFPRGKINKDEDDLDCAVREVYEETGFDIRAAGLVRPEKDMKYIEVTMREQHMRLYVFRNVPKDTYFEPRTRKEISKIEWYKLNDLPTQKKKNHHDGHEESLAVNANKFYMVAPFLHPLKKWIAQQRQKGHQYSSSLAAPPMYAEESVIEHQPITTSFVPTLDMLSPNIPSSLPEVASVQHQRHEQDPTAHLKELLKIGGFTPATEKSFPLESASESNIPSSNALLDLLRNGSTPNRYTNKIMTAGLEQAHPPPLNVSGSQHMPDHARYPPSSQQEQSSTVSPQVQQPSELRSDKQNLLQLFSKPPTSTTPTTTEPKIYPSGVSNPGLSQPSAPYQRTGDPHFARPSPEDTRSSMVPPANALPKLTQHTRALLGAFSVAPQTSSSIQLLPQPAVAQNPMSSAKQDLLNAFKSTKPEASQRPTQDESPAAPNLVKASKPVPAVEQPILDTKPEQPKSYTNLADLFRRPVKPPAAHDASTMQESQTAPVELAAAPVQAPIPQPATKQSNMLESILKTANSLMADQSDQTKRQRSTTTKAGRTGATIDTPLDQPQFDGILPPQPQSARSMHRSSAKTQRSLFDPKQPIPMKILTKEDNKQTQPTRSPRPHKASVTTSAVASPRRSTPAKEKPFQPQILRRPQTAESQECTPLTRTAIDNVSKPQPPNIMQSIPASVSVSPNPEQKRVVSPIQVTDLRRPSQQSDSHKQGLLSLFSGIPSASPATIRAPYPVSTSGMVSPMSQSQLVSPIGDEPISTRSRVGSLASITSGVAQHSGLDGRSKVEKRQTNAGDKAFLLGYLGRIANQEVE